MTTPAPNDQPRRSNGGSIGGRPGDGRPVDGGSAPGRASGGESRPRSPATGRPGGGARPRRPSDGRGERLVRADAVGTLAFALTAAAAAAVLEPVFQAPAAVVAGALFLGGCLTFTWGFLVAVERSRTEAVELSSLFFLKESSPPDVRRALLTLLAVQVVVAIVSASIRPFTSLAFGVLAPVWGLGVITLWSARHGTFPTKAERAARPPPDAPDLDPGGDRPQ